jgi:hypothetical protein
MMEKRYSMIWTGLVEVGIVYAGIVLTVHVLRIQTSLLQLERNFFGGYGIAIKTLLYIVLPSVLIASPLCPAISSLSQICSCVASFLPFSTVLT